MAFELFTPLFSKIDQVTTSFVTDISSRAIIAITPIVSVALTLGFITYGILIIRGAIDMPVLEFLKRSVQISVITSIALTGGLYQSTIAEAIRTTPDELVNSLIPSTALETNQNAASIIDKAAEAGLAKAGEAFDKASFFGRDGIVYGLLGIIILLTTSTLIALGGAILLLAKICLSILAGLAPLFIIALLWKPTMKFFDMWAAQVANYILLTVLFSAVFGLAISIFGSYMEDVAFDGETSIANALGGSVIISIAMIIILLQLPRLASALAGGVSLSYLYELNVIKGAALPSSSHNEARGASSRGTTASSSGDGSSRVGGKRDGNTNRKVPHGYFKGSKNKASK